MNHDAAAQATVQVIANNTRHQKTTTTTTTTTTPKSSIASGNSNCQPSILHDGDLSLQTRKHSSNSSATTTSNRWHNIARDKKQVFDISTRNVPSYRRPARAALISLALSTTGLLLVEFSFREPSLTSHRLSPTAGACLFHLIVLLALVTLDRPFKLARKQLVGNDNEITCDTNGEEKKYKAHQWQMLSCAESLEWALLVCSSAWSLALALLRNQLVPVQVTTALAFYLVGGSFRVHRRQLLAVLGMIHTLHLVALSYTVMGGTDRWQQLKSFPSVIFQGDQQKLNHNNSTTTTANSNSSDMAGGGGGRNGDGDGAINLSYLSHPSVQILFIGATYVIIHSIGLYLHKRCERQQTKSIEEIKQFVCSRVDLDTEDRKLTRMLESVIPGHLAIKMRHDVLAPNAAPTGNFHKSYLDSFDNVSILFADIVNFTKISSNCTPKLLVETLNELFGRFDKAANQNNCLRIKILGDCYYCVSGIPASSPDEPHARQCVEMGLDMIDILDDLARDNNQVDLKMRVGIHTGRVLSGILGKKKWQFDVYSNDVKLANHLEQSGTPGRVHITDNTLAQLKREQEKEEEEKKKKKQQHQQTVDAQSNRVAYSVEPANGHLRDAYIAERNVTTYFVLPPPGRQRHSYGSFNWSSMSASRVLGGQESRVTPPTRGRRECEIKVRVTRAPAPGEVPGAAGAQQVVVVNSEGRAETTLVRDHMNSGQQERTLDRLKRIIRGNSSQSPRQLVTTGEIDLGALSRPQVAADTLDEEEELHLLATSQVASGAEVTPGGGGGGNQQEDNLSLEPRRASSITIIGARDSVQSGGSGAGIVGARSSVSLAQSQQGPSVASKRFKQNAKKVINMQHFIRTIEAPFQNLGSSSRPHLAKMEIDKKICDTIQERSRLRDIHKWTLRFKDPVLALRYARSVGRQHRAVRLKQACVLLSAGLITLIALTYACLFGPLQFMVSPFKFTNNTLISPHDRAAMRDDQMRASKLESVALLSLFTCLYLEIALIYLHEWELDARLDFIWHERAPADKMQMARMRDCNKSIFFNLLPPHVASYFLERTHLRHMDLYYHSCDTIGVIFANIFNFSDFYQEIQGNDHGKGCLQVLNEILCEFDLLLDLARYRPIDKIKTIGSTYMAAIGLCPNYELPSLANLASIGQDQVRVEDNKTNSEQQQQQQRVEEQERLLIGYLKTMLKFVYEMRKCLNAINEHAYNSFKLRVGFNVGPVTAGVIGATKPQYDIWGNTVNVASRMESTCEPHSFIQVTEDVHSLLARSKPELIFDPGEIEPDEIRLRMTSSCRGQVDVKGKGKMTTYYLDFELAQESSLAPASACDCDNNAK